MKLAQVIRARVVAGAVVMPFVVLLLLACTGVAAAAGPVWKVGVEVPTRLSPGALGGSLASRLTGAVIVTVENAGDAATDGTGALDIALPEGITGVAVSAPGWTCGDPAGASSVHCELGGVLQPGEQAEQVKLEVRAGSSELGAVSGSARMSGGGAPVAGSATISTSISSAPDFGFQSVDGLFGAADGSADTQAGSHPYQYTVSFKVDTTTRTEVNQPGHLGEIAPDGNVKGIEAALPVGLVGDVTAIPQCPQPKLVVPLGGAFLGSQCPPSSQVGVLTLNTVFLGQHTYSLYNMVPPPGEPAQFAAVVLFAPVYIDSHVRTGGDYGLTSTLSDIPSIEPVLASTVTLWGVPADPSHESLRGCPEQVVDFGGCASTVQPRPFLTLPTTCGAPPVTTLRGDSWQQPGSFKEANFVNHDAPGDPVGFEGCNRLPFAPSIAVTPETSAVNTPTGLQVDLHTPQAGLQNPEGLAAADLQDATVTLPAGLRVNPSVAGGLAACSPAQIDLSGAAPASCPDGSKIGTVEVDTPILGHPLPGGVYVAEQGNNPFGSLLAIYVAVDDPETGVVIKLAGRIIADPVTGQLTTTFDNNPQQPFTDLKLDFFGGPRAALVTPEACGSYMTSGVFTSWSGGAAVESSDSFAIDGGCHGPMFSPSFTAGSTNDQAGASTPFSISFSRDDQEQELSGVALTMPPGLLGVLKSVERCPEPQASQGACGQGSLIGHASASAGAGSDPVAIQGGQVFLTGPYKGASFGLSIVVPAVAGPFNLGTVVVRAAISVDPHTAQIAVVSDPLPSILQGIPLQIRTVNVTIDRSGFIFNPTDCEALSVGGTLSSTQGASVGVSSHFQAANCATLPFKPSFSVSTQAKTSKKQGASLVVKGTFPSGEANIHSVAVTLPKQLPARLTTIQQACTEAVFNTNPASCPVGSNIGTATANTPILAVPLTGPVYLVSHGGAAFPDIVAILQGEGVTVDLTGSIDIKHNITSSTFASVPDAPITSFALTLPEGPHSGLAAVVPAKNKGSLCGQSLSMPFTITGQNGAVVKQPVKIAVTGCAKAKAKKKPKAKHAKPKKKK